MLRRLSRATGTLMRTTVDTFVAEYTATLQERNERIEKFNRMASHELRTPIGTLIVRRGAAQVRRRHAATGPARTGRRRRPQQR